jgi:dTDP-4-dehydrorhamnose reductase
MNSKIIVTGANGQLGSELRFLAKAFPDYEFHFFGRSELSIDNEQEVTERFAELQPVYCINCAAYTAVDKAESEIDQAFKVNGWSTGVLAKASALCGARFIHISTDYVFNGQGTRPYVEDDAVEPVNAYGASKLNGEQLAMENNPEAVIIRTSWVYSEYGANFVKTMIRLMKDRESLGVVSDQQGSPTYAADLALVIMNIIDSGSWYPGIYHYSNEGIITWFDFASEIRNQIQSKCIVNPIKTEQFPTPAKRPAYSVFDTSKLKQTFGLEIPHWKDSLAVCIEKLLKI